MKVVTALAAFLMLSASMLCAQAGVNPRTLPADTTPVDGDLWATWKASPVATKSLTIGTLKTILTPTSRVITCTPPLLCDGGASMTFVADRTLAVNEQSFTTSGVTKARVVNVDAKNADGTPQFGTLGAADDTAVFQAAIDYAAGLSTKAVVVAPAGTYFVHRLKMRSYVDFIGQGMATQLKAPATASGGAIIELFDGSVKQVRIANLFLNGNRLAGAATHCMFLDNSGGTFTPDASPMLIVENIFADYCGLDGFRLISRDLMMSRCRSRVAGQDGFSFLNGTGGMAMTDGTFSHLSSDASVRDGLHFESCCNTTTNVKVGEAGRYGIYFASGANANTLGDIFIDNTGYPSHASGTPINVQANDTNFSPFLISRGGAGVGILLGSGATRNYVEGSVWQNGGTLTNALDITAGGSANVVSLVTDLGTPVTGTTSLTANAITINGRDYISATDRLLGRDSAGAGPVEEIALSAISHNALGDLATGDVHTQYFLLAGRAGGQSPICGTGAGDDCTITSTSNATKGDVKIGTWATLDEVNQRVGVRTQAPTAPIHVLMAGTPFAFNSLTGAAVQKSGVANDVAVLTLLSGNTGSGQLWFGDTDSETIGRIIYEHSTNRLQFYVNAQNRVYIDANGNMGIGTATFGTSAATVFALANGTAPTTSPADTVQLWSADTTAGDANLYSRNEAGIAEQLTGLRKRVKTQFDKTSDITLENVADLTFNVEAGKSYGLSAILFTTSNVAGGVKAAIGGTATATAIIYEGELHDGGLVKTRGTALATEVCAVTAATTSTCYLRGTITVNAAGTLTVQFAQNASNAAASSVLVGSQFYLEPIGN